MNNDIDLSLGCSISIPDGIGRQFLLISAIKDDFNINILPLSKNNYKDVPPDLLKILIKPFNGFGKIFFQTSILGTNEGSINIHKSISSQLKISYSMFESDAIPQLWVDILNNYYDMVVVPDNYLIDVYKNSGVKIPIFMIPL